MILETIQKAFRHITFYEEGHRYWDDKLKHFGKSSTTYKKDVVPKFDSDYWLPKKATEYGITVEQLKFAWDYLRDLGLERGSAIHRYIEERCRGKYISFDKIYLLDKLIKMADKYLEDFKDDINIANELVIGNGICYGQIDRLVIRNGKLILVDFKNDKKFTKTSRFGNLLAPFNDLPKCNYSEYRIQLSIYKWIFEEMTGLQIDSMEIIWLSPEQDTYHLIPIKPISSKRINDWIRNGNNKPVINFKV